MTGGAKALESGLALLADDDAAGALADFEQARRLAPDDPEPAFLAGRAAYLAGVGARGALAEALRLAPGNPGTVIALADALIAEEGFAAAETVVCGHLALAPRDPALHTWLAKQRWMAGDAGFARNIDAALAAAPADTALWQARVALDFQRQDYRAALANVAAAERGTGVAWAAQRATCLDELGDAAAAAALFERLDPRADAGLAVRIARHHLRKGHPNRAYAACEPWLGQPQAETVWPYVALAWRMASDPRWAWLEGREELIGIHDEVLPAGKLAELADAVRWLHTARRQPLDQSLRGGTQTAGHLLARCEPIFRELRAALVDRVAAHIAALPPRDPFHPTLRHPRDRPVRFSGSWSVRLRDGGHHAAHVHSEGWLSSAFYLALPSGAGESVPGAGELELGLPGEELGLDLEPLRTIEPRPGRLALFPSTMWHATRPFTAGERLTIAFDVAPP